jgi:hypothetical protein
MTSYNVTWVQRNTNRNKFTMQHKAMQKQGNIQYNCILKLREIGKVRSRNIYTF